MPEKDSSPPRFVALRLKHKNAYDAVAMLFYLIVYAIATSGSFVALAYLAGRDKEINDVDDLAGLGRIYPFISAALALFLFSLAGLPPLAGFWGKFTLFLSALDVGDAEHNQRIWFLTLAIVAGLNAAVAAAYYLRLVAMMSLIWR